METAIVVVARTGSSRVPRKMMADIAGVPLLERLIERLKQAKQPESIILATTCLPEDNQLGSLALQKGLQVYRGAVEDVIERMLGACQTYSVDFAIIAEGDELFCDASYIDRVIQLARQTEADCVKTHHLPIGSWIVGVRRKALEKVYENKGDASTEAFSRFFTEDSHYHTEWLEPDATLPDFDTNLRLTVDYEEDLELANEIYRRLGPQEAMSLESVLKLVKREPSLLRINSFLNDEYWVRIRSRIAQTDSESKEGE